jgi:Fur family transcriptional regulator, ferric uptake regulator
MSSETIQRNTRQRQVILEELRKLKSHPTAAMLYDVVRRRIPKISLGTVYRNLELLSRMGAIEKLEFSSGEARFDGTVKQHDHLRCMCCGRLDDVPGPARELNDSGKAAAGGKEKWGGYRIIGHRLEFLGICPDCRRSQSD